MPDFDRAAFGELVTANLRPALALRFDYGILTNMVSTSGTANGGSVTQSDSDALLQTGTAADGIARMVSKKFLRYLPGMGGLLRFTAPMLDTAENSQHLAGIGDTLDGFFVGYRETQFGVMRRRGGVDKWTDITNPGFTPAYGHPLQIRFQYLGYGAIIFEVERPGGYGAFTHLHRIDYAGTAQQTSIMNPTLPAFFEVKNTGNTSNLRMKIGSVMAAVEGQPGGNVLNPLDFPHSFSRTATWSNADNTLFMAITNPTTFNGRTNRVPLRMSSLNLGREAAGPKFSVIRLYKSPTLSGALTQAAIESGLSPATSAVDAVTITAGTAIRSYILTNATTLLEAKFEPGEIVVYPGENMVVAVQNAAATAGDISISTNWFDEL